MICSAIRRTERTLAPAVLLGALLLATSARADPQDASTARGLFFEGRRLMAEGHWAEASAKLEESERLDPGKGTEFNLADCYEHLGRLASAWTLFERVVAESHDAKQPEHEALARKRAEALASRVPTITVEVPDAARVSGLEVSLDGHAVPSASWSVPTRVDPGDHELAARAPDHLAWQTTVHLAEADHPVVQVATLADETPTPPVPATPTTAEPVAPPPPPPLPVSMPARPTRESSEPGSGQRILGVVVGGAGGGGLLVAGMFGVFSLDQHNQANQWCSASTNACSSQRGVDARSDALTFGDVATVATIAGGALLVTGLVLLVTAPHATHGQAASMSFGGPPGSLLGGTF